MSLQSVKDELTQIEEALAPASAAPSKPVLVESGDAATAPTTPDARIASVAAQMKGLADQLQAVSEDVRKIAGQLTEASE